MSGQWCGTALWEREIYLHEVMGFIKLTLCWKCDSVERMGIMSFVS